MPRDLKFEITGDPSGGINAFKALRKEAEDTGKALRESMASVATMSKDLASVVSLMRGLREGALASARAVRSMSANLSGVGARSREVTAALKHQSTAVNQATAGLQKQATAAAQVTQHVAASARASHAMRASVGAAAAQTGVLRSGLAASSALLGRMVTQAALLSNRLAVGARSASIATRGGLAGTAQGLQGLGIGFRMSGLAVGNQLANMGGQGIAGLLGGLVGAAAAGTEMAVRLVSSLTGTAVRLLGSASNLILAPIGALVQGVGELVGGVFSKAIGGTVSMALQAAGNFVSAFTNLIGEAVSQVGNIFTGVVEAARGAFQGAVNIASNLLGSLVGVAESVMNKIGGVLGTVGKTVLGIGGTLAGFALNDFMGTESGLMKGMVLLDDKLSPADKKNLRSWAEDLHRQMPTVSREAIGSTFQRVVSTGFSGDLPGAKKATAAAMRLQFATEGGGDPAEAARVVAKAFSVYRDELEKFPDPLARITDLLFQTVNAADVSLGDLVGHLGMVLGPAKSLGMSLEELLTLIAKMSRTADVEQTFTGLRRLLLEPLKMSKDATDVLGKHGLSASTLSAAETNAIRERQQAISDKEDEIAALEGAKRRGPEVAGHDAKQRIAALKAADVEIARAMTPFMRKRAVLAKKELELAFATTDAGASGTPRADATETIKSAKAELKQMKDELKDFEKTAGSVTNVKAFIDSLSKAGLSAKELSVVFPDIRALVAAMTLSTQDPKMGEQIESMITGSSGKVNEAVAAQGDTMKVKLLQLWEGLKSPFKATLNALETPFKGFIDRMTEGLMGLTKWWEKAINHPGAGRLLGNIGGKMGGLVSSLGLGGLSMPGQGDFWRTLETGLNKVWAIGTSVTNAFKTLGGAIAAIARESSLLGSVWEKVKAAGSWLSDTGKQLANGSTKNLGDAWNAGKGVFDTLWAGAEKFITPLLEKAKSIYSSVIETARGVFNGIGAVLNTALAGLKAVLPLLAAYALAPAARAIGAAFRAPPLIYSQGGAAGAGGGAMAGGASVLMGGGVGGGSYNYDPVMGPPKGGFKYGMGRIGGAVKRGFGAAGRWAGSGGGAMALGLGASVLGGSLAENGSPVAGGALQGAAIGSLGFMVNPIVGLVTTAAGALIGAFNGARDAANALADSQRAAAGARAASAVGSMSGMSVVQQAQRLRAMGHDALKAQDWNAVGAFGTQATGVVRGGTIGAIGMAGDGDYEGALDTVKGLHAIEKHTVEQVFKDRGEDFEQVVIAWTAALEKSRAVIQHAATDKALAARAGGVFGERTAGIGREIDGAQTAMSDFEDGVTRASDSANELSDWVRKLEAAAIGAFGALQDVPPGSEEAAKGLREAAQAALEMATVARTVRRAALGAAEGGRNMSLEDMDLPGLDNIFNKPHHRIGPAEAAAPALKATAQAAEAASTALEGLTLSTAKAAVATAGGTGLSPAGVSMTGGEARSLKSQLRKERHAERNRSHEKYDQFGNKIDPFTGWPTVGDEGGIGWGVREGSGDMGSAKDMYGSSRGKGTKFTKPYSAKVANDDGSEYTPSAVGPGGNLQPVATAAKGAEGAAKGAANATRDAATAITGTGKAMNDVTKAATETARKAREGVAVTREGLAALNDENMRQDTELDALRAAVGAISAGEGSV